MNHQTIGHPRTPKAPAETTRFSLPRRAPPAQELIIADLLHEPLTQGTRPPMNPSPTASPPPVAWTYLRVSTKRQAQKGGEPEGYSLPVQRQVCGQKAGALGAVVAQEFIDRGESARKANRPDLQRLLRALEEQIPPTYLIVYKVDRWARDSVDGALLVQELRKHGVQLISAGEGIDDSPEGRLMLTILLGMAEYESTGKAGRIRDNMRRAAEQGVTMGRAAVGYTNTRTYVDGREYKSVEIDPDRAELVQWTFEAYATGEWTTRKLADELEVKGLTLAPSANKPTRPISSSQVHRMLTNRAYLGEVRFEGVWYPGKHQPLVSRQLFDKVGEILKAKNHAGEKHRKRAHYLKGTIFCGQCGSRLCISYNRGRDGTLYEYFFCLARQKRRAPCTQPHLRVHAVEEAVERFYDHVRLQAHEITKVREVIEIETEALAAETTREARRQQKRLDQLAYQRTKLLEAHYASAVPLDVLKSDMDRIDREQADARAQLEAAEQPLGKLAESLVILETVVSEVDRLYRQADDRGRRQINQGLFEKIYITRDGISGADPSGLLDGTISVPILIPSRSGPGLEAPEGCQERQNPSGVPPTGSSNPAVSNIAQLVGRLGLEPSTLGLKVPCSNQMS